MGLVFGERENPEYPEKTMEQRQNRRGLYYELQGYQVGTAHMQVIWKSFVLIFSAGILGSKEEYQ